MPLPKPSRGALRSLRIPRSQRSFQYARSTRRGYASAQDTAKEGAQKLGSDMPWAVSSLVATVAGTWLVASGHKFEDPLVHPMPGDHYHGEEHGDDEEHEEEGADGEEGAESGGDEQEQEVGDDKGDDEESAKTNGKKDGDQGEDEKGSGDNDDSDDSEQTGGQDQQEDKKPSSGGKLSGKRVPGQPEDNISKRTGGPWDQPAELEKGPNGQTRLHIPDAKGGVKRRSESAKGIVQGSADPSDTKSGSIGDVKDGSTSAVAGNVSKQQKGLSNTDTKHSIDLMKGDQYSKKPEGVPETAKITETVDPKRSAR